MSASGIQLLSEFINADESAQKLILYFIGTNDLFQVFCPFKGQFTLKYVDMNVNEAECHELSNCQGGYELKFLSRPCNQGQNGLEKGQFKVTTFQCLGHWSTNFPGKQMAIFKSEKDYKCAVSIRSISDVLLNRLKVDFRSK